MRKNIVWAVSLILIIIALSGCSGVSSGDSARDTMSVTISSPTGATTTTTYTEGTYSTNSTGYSFLNPNVFAYIDAFNVTTIRLQYWDGVSTGSPYNTIIHMQIIGNTPGLYPSGDRYMGNDISCDTNDQPYTSIFSNTSGTITLSGVGNVGDKITGTFDAVVSRLTNTNDTLRISGSFSVTRDGCTEHLPMDPERCTRL